MTELHELQSKIEEMQAELRRIRDQYMAQSQVKFTELVMTIFEEFPQLQAISWCQGTPGWCDGEVCTFSIYGVDLFFDDDTLAYWGEHADESWNDYGESLCVNSENGKIPVETGNMLLRDRWGYTDRLHTKWGVTHQEEYPEVEYVYPVDWFPVLAATVNDIINTSNQDLLVNTFGDGALIKISRNGTTEVTEYELEG